jgi:hypothetical protein
MDTETMLLMLHHMVVVMARLWRSGGHSRHRLAALKM